MGQILLITGATGLVGKALVKHCLAEGYTVHYLTTRKSKIIKQKNHKGFYWNPQNNTIDTACFEGVEVIVNLAGASIAQRWSCLLYTSPSPRDRTRSRMPSSA